MSRRYRGRGRCGYVPPSRPGRHSSIAFTGTPLPNSGNVNITLTSSVVRNSDSIITTASNIASNTSTTASTVVESIPELERLSEVSDLVRIMNNRVRCLEDKTSKLTGVIQELSLLMKRHCKQTFSIKGSPFEASIKSEVAKLFCLSIKRKPADADIQEVILMVMGREARERHKFDMAFSFAKSKLTEFRTEERRKVIGISPYESKPFCDTASLGDHLVRCMQPPSEMDVNIYIKHLVILRKFVRERIDIPATNFYVTFREWLDEHYSTINQETWLEICDEDSSINYSIVGNGIPLQNEGIISNYVEVGNSDNSDN